MPRTNAPTRGQAKACGVPQADGAEDPALVCALVDNDPVAWKAFHTAFHRLIVRCIARVTVRFSAVGAEDLREIQAQLYVSLLANDRAKLRAFDPDRGASLSSYVGMLATHAAYDWLRARRREPRRENLALAEDLASDAPDPCDTALRRERAKLASRVLRDFSERDRTFATLYFGEGLEPDEIARSMNISVKTVYSKRHKIQARLESVVADLGLRLAA